MSATARNTIVGLFTAVGIVIIGWMTLNFKGGRQLAFLRQGYEIRVTFDSLEGMGEGTEVRFNGKRVGLVTRSEIDLEFVNPPQVVVEIEEKYKLPRNCEVRLVSEMFGRRYIEFVYRRHPGDTRPVEFWPRDGSAMIAGEARPSGLDQVGSTVKALEKQMAEVLDQTANVMRDLDKAVEENRKGVRESIEGIRNMLGNPENQKNLAKTLAFVGDDKLHASIRESVDGVKALTGPKVVANVTATMEDVRAAAKDARDITASLKKTAVEVEAIAARVDKLIANVDGQVTELGGSGKRISADAEGLIKELRVELKSVTGKVNDHMVQVGRILQSVQTVARNIETGQGTAGKLLADPRLYESMVDLVNLLKMTGEELRGLAKNWREGGIRIQF